MRYVMIILFLASAAAVAEDNALPPGLEPVPDGSPTLQDTPPVQDPTKKPEVTVIRQLDGTVEEYRVNGKLYMVRVLPEKGRPYFLIDSDGDGMMDSRYNSKDERIVIPGWVILDW